MNLEESIASRSKVIEVSAGKMSAAQLAIRDAGGWVYRMDVDRSKYTLHIHWDQPSQKELL